MSSVSIVLPVYNGAKTIVDAVNSVLDSNFTDYEIIIVDDGSTDETREVLKQYLSHPKISYIFQQNRGLSSARNTGINNSKGNYLVFLDDDDVIGVEKLASQSTFLNLHPKIGVVYSESMWFKENDLSDTRQVVFPKYSGNILPELLNGNFIHVNSVMVRTEIIKDVGGFDDDLKELEDWDLWLRLSLHNNIFSFQKGVHSMVRIRKGSMTFDQKKMNQTSVKVLKKALIQLINFNYDRRLILDTHYLIFIFRIKCILIGCISYLKR